MFRMIGLVVCSMMVSLAMPLVANAADVIHASLVACPTGTKIGDVGSCGKIWKLKSGHASLSADGTLKAEVKGLMLNDASTGQFNGTPDGVGGGVSTQWRTRVVRDAHRGRAPASPAARCPRHVRRSPGAGSRIWTENNRHVC